MFLLFRNCTVTWAYIVVFLIGLNFENTHFKSTKVDLKKIERIFSVGHSNIYE